MQEVFVECLKPGGVLERADAAQGELRGLLRRVVQNVARRYEERAIKRGRIRPADTVWFAEVQDDEPGQATVFDRCWAHSIIEEATKRFRELAAQDGEAGQRRDDAPIGRRLCSRPIRVLRPTRQANRRGRYRSSAANSGHTPRTG